MDESGMEGNEFDFYLEYFQIENIMHVGSLES